VLASHLGKPRLAGLHDFVQVLDGIVFDRNWLNFVPMNNPFNTKHSCPSSPLLTGQGCLALTSSAGRTTRGSISPGALSRR
jgi:hypothetical protein